MRKKLLICLVCILICIPNLSPSFAVDITGGYIGINSYSYCSYGNRAGKSYVENLNLYVDASIVDGSNTYTRSFNYTDSSATTSIMANLPSVTFFAFSGHGLHMDAQGSTIYANQNSLHFNKASSGTVTNHLSIDETSGIINYTTNSARFSHKYVTIYSCN